MQNITHSAGDAPGLLERECSKNISKYKPNLDANADFYNISNRQKQCLNYLAQGLSAKNIGKELNLSPRTVEAYIESLKLKFKCKNKTLLIVKFVKSNYIN
jgi:DNA-binding NarL/FixJ family response regulator